MASDERDEGRWIAAEIEHQRSQRAFPYDEIAVFYRTNAQSRSIEDMLPCAGVPYRIVGGTRFFDRAEIRDVMAYLTLLVNPADDITPPSARSTSRAAASVAPPSNTSIQRLVMTNMPFHAGGRAVPGR